MTAAALIARSELGSAGRVVVKVGSSSLTSPDGRLDPDRLRALVDVLAARRAAGGQVVLVSSGAIAAAIGPLGLAARPRDLATQQAAASVGQGLLVAHYTKAFADHGLRVGQVLLTADDTVRRGHYRNAHRALTRLLDLGVVPIINENDAVATDEIRFGDNDRLAALVSHLVHADALVLLTDVDALYTAAPSQPGSRRIARVDGPRDLEGVDVSRRGSAVGTGGMVTKLESVAIATGSGIPVVLTSAAQAAQALEGDDVGTWFAATGRRKPIRLLWLAHAARMRGRLVLDEGAVRAVVERRTSLLPAGVTAVEGTFEAGDPVEIVAPDGRVVARGLVAFGADEVPSLLGRSTHDLRRELGAGYDRELVHRDDLVLVRRRQA
ncbi:MAG: glutamate 5-kinase [Cellulomonas sp.]|uniref:Glutamate 5-kinase n=1 Tax=Cellulomonas gelida TaxID=1712 RepID=A0A4Y3KJY7_9CELL|nr:MULTISPECIES: glutamate 5-kinase [Cellulomonas]KMM45508.1 gamma-glutamyl kinase [Cellulomonas sp. A375-1]MCR6647938.1 glutamate 5-kinase [Cellulomonas sp.]MCR6703870.1 glutamate 5-kinase [Cellulomonas sp.]GEA83435.1 glutamate 5-kinase [Cellulomonas gelida]GGL25000.1 glutamate 5-kinase [Cellulomonas gelida]